MKKFQKMGRLHCLRHEEIMRSDHGSYRIGLGYAGVSKLLFHKYNRGITYRNYSNREEGITRYLSFWQQDQFDQFPVEHCFIYTGADLMLNYISGALQTFRIDLNELNSNFPEVHIEKYMASVLDALLEMKWIKISKSSIEVTHEGRFFTHIIQGAFFYKRVSELRS